LVTIGVAVDHPVRVGWLAGSMLAVAASALWIWWAQRWYERGLAVLVPDSVLATFDIRSFLICRPHSAVLPGY
jgi:hypothetical protein